MKFSDSSIPLSNRKPTYIILEIDFEDIPSDVRSLHEGVWRSAKISGYSYRVDPADPEKNLQRHIHIAHDKHKNATNKQVSWNEDGKRHDRNKFDTGFSGMNSAESIARKVLGISDSILLEDYTPSAAKVLLLESEDPDDTIFLRKAALK